MKLHNTSRSQRLSAVGTTFIGMEGRLTLQLRGGEGVSGHGHKDEEKDEVFMIMEMFLS